MFIDLHEHSQIFTFVKFQSGSCLANDGFHYFLSLMWSSFSTTYFFRLTPTKPSYQSVRAHKHERKCRRRVLPDQRIPTNQHRANKTTRQKQYVHVPFRHVLSHPKKQTRGSCSPARSTGLLGPSQLEKELFLRWRRPVAAWRRGSGRRSGAGSRALVDLISWAARRVGVA